MRVVLAGLFVFVGTALVVGLMSTIPGSEAPVWFVSSVAIVTFFVLLLVAMWLFNLRSLRALPIRAEDFIERLERQGLIRDDAFQAVRAFEVAEFEDEGSHYFIELVDGTVLYLNGQYLYDYEPIDDDPELNQPRRFPCTRFTVRRHRTESYVVEIDCRGPVLEPEGLAPCFDRDGYRHGRIPEDGQILSGRSYESLRLERLGQTNLG